MNQKQYHDLDEVIKLWQEKLVFLEKEKVIETRLDRKFELEKQIDECQQEIQRLEKFKSSSVSSTEISNLSSYSKEKLDYLNYYLNAFEDLVKYKSLLTLFGEQSLQVKDWKTLHDQFQKLSIKLISVRGIVSSNKDYKSMLQDLEDHWRYECSSNINLYTQFSSISSKVRAQLEELDRSTNWLKQLKYLTKKINDEVDKCKNSKKLKTKIKSIRYSLSSLEKINGSFLGYLDDQLQENISKEISRLSLFSHIDKQSRNN